MRLPSNGISIGSAIFEQLTFVPAHQTYRHTDHATCNICSNIATSFLSIVAGCVACCPLVSHLKVSMFTIMVRCGLVDVQSFSVRALHFLAKCGSGMVNIDIR